MPKGTPMAPELLALIGELYVRTGNISETARTLNLPFETVRDALARGENARRRQLNAQALEEGLCEGREHLVNALRTAGDMLTAETKSGQSLEPSDVGALARAIAQASVAVARLDEREERRETVPLQRALLEANTARARAEADLALAQAEVARAKAREGSSPDDVLRNATVEQLVELLAVLRARRAAPAPAPSPAPASAPAESTNPSGPTASAGESTTEGT